MRTVEIEKGIGVEIDSLPDDVRIVCMTKESVHEMLKAAVISGMVAGVITVSAGLFIRTLFLMYAD